MAASRDDFIIAIRSAFIKKGNKQRFSLIGLIFFSIGLLILSKINLPVTNYLKITLNEIVYRSSFIISIPEKKIQDFSNKVIDHYNVYNDYLLVKEKIKTLQSKKYETQFLEEENKRLKKTINEYIYNSEELVAKVLIDKNSPFLKSIIINKGTSNGVLKGMPVTKNNYLVGRVVESNYLSSRVLLLNDLNSRIPVTLEEGAQAILSGSSFKNPVLEYLPDDYELIEGINIFASGKDGIFAAGTPIGVTNDEREVNLFVDPNQLSFVTVNLVKQNKENF